MKTIQVDDEVFECIRSAAVAFEDTTPNDALRRIFGIRSRPRKQGGVADLDHMLDDLLAKAPRKRTKAPKADLSELIHKGFVSDGELLSLLNYKNERVHGRTAQISGSRLSYEGRHYSMSELARLLLKKEGFDSKAVRGPAHWANAEGKTISDLWNDLMAREELVKP
ncbi:MAG TPA: hypothetical protein VFK24_02490 [Gammaproteobacteria bacterium]|nr:hypothetical protein [Gammaproteobacteria bacterium]